MKSNHRSETLRMHGFALGFVLFVASILVALSMTAAVNLVLFALPILALAAVISMIVVGVPLAFAAIHWSKADTQSTLAPHDNAVLLSLEGFWRHAHSWDKGQAHYIGFEPVDHDIVIHLDSKSDDSSMTMREFMQMTSRAPGRAREVEKSLEGLKDYR